MQVRFLLGPAGSGKTSQCLEEVRNALLAKPEGPPLIFLAPKQATFQIERQLLGDARLKGFTRLFIYSFERLADFALDAIAHPIPRLLSEDGRVMLLRALLAQAVRVNELQLFRASARLPGFAQDLSKVIRECQRASAGPSKLRDAARRFEQAGTRQNLALAAKLNDLALLFEWYNERLATENLEDADRLLDTAASALRSPKSSQHAPAMLCEALWMDGFAEMTVQELELLTAFLPWCGKATLAFCCEGEAVDAALANTGKPSSPWSVVAETASRCLIKISEIADVERIGLPRNTPGSRLKGRASKTPAEDGNQLELFGFHVAPAAPKQEPATFRFVQNVELAHLERHWATPNPRGGVPESVRLIRCRNAEAEVTFAAREIRRHVAQGGRFRDAAVLVREMRGYHDVIHRVFARYEIPHFLDRRESVAHHPLAELTRYALRTIARDWRHEDWFGVLKSGLCCTAEDCDWLENLALERGWSGDTWLTPLDMPGNAELAARLEQVRQKTVMPLRDLRDAIVGAPGGTPNGAELAAALRTLWAACDVEKQLARWTAETPEKAVHSTVWEQMHEWLNTLSLAFAHERLRLREDWLAIVDAGLATLTVGVIPPVLDEVLIGSIDRSRNPELQITFVLGVNDGVFPAIPPGPPLLTEADRLELEGMLHLGASARQQLAHERFYAYIAFTRARDRLFVSYSETDRAGKKLSPSVFVTHLQRLFPDLQPENSDARADVVHVSEVAVPLIRAAWAEKTPTASPALVPLIERFRSLPPPFKPQKEPLPPDLASKLYPPRLVTSVSRLEEFASCAFRFFVTVGLRAKERLRFEVDPRRTGTFQHEVLMAFHQKVQEQNLRWRDLSPAQARQLVAAAAAERVSTFQRGVLVATPRDRVQTDNLIEALQDFIETVVAWAPQYEFDPVKVELDFNDEGSLPAWELTLDHTRKLAFTGTIDRVDALIDRAQRHAHLVVVDYKSSAKQVDPKLLDAGVQLQLFAYLAALCRLPETARMLDVGTVSPAGVFFVKLRAPYEGAASRDAAFADAESARRKLYRHRGRFVRELLQQFDSAAAPGHSSEQFAFKIRNDGEIYASNTDPIPASEFVRLLNRVEQQLVDLGNRVFSGEISLNPYRYKNQTPCERCNYSAFCRVDAWTHEFRNL